MRSTQVRSWGLLPLTVLVVLTLQVGCGGGDERGEDPPAALNQYETDLVGRYVLVSFELVIGGITFDETDFVDWSGQLLLFNTHRYSLHIYLDDGASVVDEPTTGDWQATDSDTLLQRQDGAAWESLAYSLNVDDLVAYYVDASGNSVLRRWLRTN